MRAGRILFLQIAIFAIVLAQAPARAPRAPRPNISGQVLDTATGRPVPQATINLAPPSSRIEPGPEAYRLATSDGLGRFALYAVRPGYYSLGATASGFTSAGPGATVSVRLEAGKNVNGVQLLLDRGGTIRGTVSDADGDIPINASVQLWEPVFLEGSRHYEPRKGPPVPVRADGTFVFGGLRPGRYYVSGSRLDPPADNQASPTEDVETFFPNAVTLSEARVIEVRSGSEINNIAIRMRKEPFFAIRARS